MIIKTLLNKLRSSIDNGHQPTEPQFENIIKFTLDCGLHLKTHFNDVCKLQESAVRLENSGIELRSLIDLASLSCVDIRGDDVFPSSNDILAPTICKLTLALSKSIKSEKCFDTEKKLLKPRHILRLLNLIESNAFMDTTQNMLDATRHLAKELFIRHANGQTISMEYVVAIALHFLYHDVYDDTILDAVYEDNRIVTPLDCKKCQKGSFEPSKVEMKEILYQLKPSLQMAEKNYQGIIVRRGFLMIDGILAVNYPSYLKAGRKLDSSSMLYTNAWFGKLIFSA